MTEPRALVEHFFRHEFGWLCAVLTRSLGVRRLTLVEDVVQAALVQALETWSRRGVPEDPAGWLTAPPATWGQASSTARRTTDYEASARFCLHSRQSIGPAREGSVEVEGGAD
jgi:predicted RNA polymerase sigma factor